MLIKDLNILLYVPYVLSMIIIHELMTRQLDQQKWNKGEDTTTTTFNTFEKK